MSEPITKTDANLAMLLRDIKPFAGKTLGSIRIGIDEVRSILALAEAYDALAAGGTYRLLAAGDLIEKGDEVLSDDTLSWIPLSGWEIGMPYRPEVFQPARRAALPV